MLTELIGRHHVEVHAPHCDITDRAAVAAVAAEYAGTGASLLIHTAGIAAASRHAEFTGADVAAVCAAKVAGLARDGRRVAAATGMPDPGLLVGIRCLGRSRSRRLRGVQPDPRRAGRPTARNGAGLHGNSMGAVAGRRGGRGRRDRPHRTLRPDRDAGRVGGSRQPGPLRRRPVDIRRGLRPASGVLRKPGNADAVRPAADTDGSERDEFDHDRSSRWC